jgi:hypothetical protein
LEFLGRTASDGAILFIRFTNEGSTIRVGNGVAEWDIGGLTAKFKIIGDGAVLFGADKTIIDDWVAR